MAHENDWVADVIDDASIPWKPKEWTGLTSFDGYNIWTDGEDIYYNRYRLNRSASTWTEVRWTGIGTLYGGYIWTDGEHIYYSDGTTQKVLVDKSTSTWENKTWSGLTSFDGHYIWTDGNDIYYSNNQTQYVLDKSTSTWVAKTWTGLTSFDGYNIWTDGEDIYYSRYGVNYVLNKNTNSWQSKTWSGLDRPAAFLGQDVWTDGNDIYYSCLLYGTQTYSANYVLDKSTSRWIPKPWSGMEFSGSCIWTDGQVIYLSYGNEQYRFIPKPITSTPYRLNFPEMIESTDLRDKWLIDDDVPYRMNFPPMIPSIDINSWVIDDDIPYRLNFPELKESVDIYNSWLISDDIPFRWNFPPLIPTATPSDSWLQDKGWDPRRPWPEHRSIIQKVQTIPNIPDVDWTKSMQQTFEFYTVDPNSWYDDQKLENIISCDLTHDLTSDKRGNASITITEALPESYIRTYLVVNQAGYMHKICLGTYLYMTSSDSFDGMKHNITMTGYTPMVELEEKLPPLGFHIVGITNRKHSGDAPMVTDAIKDIVTTYTRCEIENRTVIQKPLLNDFVAGTNDNFLTVINNILNASSLGQYILTVDEWGTIIVKDKPVLEDAIPTYIYTDDNSSILLPSLDTSDDIYGIPNVVEVLYTGDKRLPAIRVIVKNEDPTSIVSIPARGREIAKRFTITNIAAPVNDYSEEAVRAQVTAQAERLLEAASTINKTISYSHGYCDVKVGDTVLINYERAGVTGIRAKVVSQRISCKPGCQVDEQAVYTKKLWNRGV